MGKQMIVPSHRECEPHQRRWRSYCVDRNLEDSWLEKLNSLFCLNLISICEGHQNSRAPRGVYPHINLRLKEQYLPLLLNDFDNIAQKLQTEFMQFFGNENTYADMTTTIRLYVSPGQQGIRRDFVIHIECLQARTSVMLDQFTKDWFSSITDRICEIDKILTEFFPTLNKLKINPEKLAYWYFRLNGCFTITNFVIHPDQGREQRTDVDIMAIRLPFRSELLTNPMRDDEIFLVNDDRIKIILAEVKQSTCNLNGPWRDPALQNMQRAIRAAGSFPENKVEEAANSLYQFGVYEDEKFIMTLFCIGRNINREIKKKYPKVPQVTWEDILSFIYNRFKTYQEQKCSHPQWDRYGREIFKLAINSKKKEEFIKSVIIEAY